MTALTEATHVPHPEYDREAVRVGIVHFGLGNFHRAHQAMYLDRLMAAGTGQDWGICGVGTRPADRRMHQVLEDQSYLYTLILKSGVGEPAPTIIGSIVDHLMANDDRDAVLARLSDPGVRIVSLTITEGGYRRNGAPSEDSVDVFDLIAEGLAARRTAGVQPFTVMSCDNLPHNGDAARRAVVDAAGRLGQEFADWVDRAVAFPSSMVDRITPVTTEEDRELVRTRFGLDDDWPVPAEPFAQWVLEDRFTLGRPPLEEAGVQMVADVAPFELMKLRLLNASHQAMAYSGILLGHSSVAAAAGDPLVEAFLRRYMAEARPTLPPVPGTDVRGYSESLLERFRNPAIADTLGRLATDSANRLAAFLVPVILDNLRAGRSVNASTAVLACWAHACANAVGDAQPQVSSTLRAAASAASEDPARFADEVEIFEPVIGYVEFRTALARGIASIRDRGVKAFLEEVAAEPGSR
ncbi:mannitol dehydrogenase family protein [Demequina sp. SYSU T00192]|uniref:Mannitol-1-phosphate 5-dehydrogenase n=1 Tax=Demequina litoralis TaxID=3051660 RepID=A0ABT8G804_9MICO|nr:mannitol dehydrogenase family protein [Demequina sp. SYSU T00192]MDN4475286.1 mannitol dehydrogenase family protein [Demequina sp. SYSU T00192]